MPTGRRTRSWSPRRLSWRVGLLGWRLAGRSRPATLPSARRPRRLRSWRSLSLMSTQYARGRAPAARGSAVARRACWWPLQHTAALFRSSSLGWPPCAARAARSTRPSTVEQAVAGGGLRFWLSKCSPLNFLGWDGGVIAPSTLHTMPPCAKLTRIRSHKPYFWRRVLTKEYTRPFDFVWLLDDDLLWCAEGSWRSRLRPFGDVRYWLAGGLPRLRLMPSFGR